MVNKYRTIPTEELVRMWRERRTMVQAPETIGELVDIRKELDRRKGNGNPSSSVDFEQFVTD